MTVFLVLFVSFTVTYSSIALYLLSPRASQQFIGFGIFSDQGTLTDYLPGSGLSVTGNQTVRWRFQIENRMGTVEFVRIIFRIGNQTTQSPNETSPAASVPFVGMVDRFIPDNVDESLAFDWELESIRFTGGLVVPVLRLGNASPTVSPVGASTGRNFRFIFELWMFDESSGDFTYGWRSGGTSYASWLQVWFDII